jgi:hypothetical protein
VPTSLIERQVAIAARHLVPKQLSRNGLTTEHIEFPSDIIGCAPRCSGSLIRSLSLMTCLRSAIASDYTREAGVRSLERAISGVYRYVVGTRCRVTRLVRAPAVCRHVAVRVARHRHNMLTGGGGGAGGGGGGTGMVEAGATCDTTTVVDDDATELLRGCAASGAVTHYSRHRGAGAARTVVRGFCSHAMLCSAVGDIDCGSTPAGRSGEAQCPRGCAPYGTVYATAVKGRSGGAGGQDSTPAAAAAAAAGDDGFVKARARRPRCCGSRLICLCFAL